MVNLLEYEAAFYTVFCYSQLHKYPLFIIDFFKNKTLQKICSHSDFMFRRHCAVVELLKDNIDINYILFLDADMSVINPNHLIEEYIFSNPKANLIFYERLFNFEIMAGSYIAKRTDFTIEFLNLWANYFYKLPKSFHGTDNGAIHNVFLNVLCYNCSIQKQLLCTNLWKKSKNFNDLQLYSSCVRSVLGDRNLFAHEKINLRTNYNGYWARDGWLTNNQWSENDFILHGWQKKRLNKLHFAGWVLPIIFDYKINLNFFSQTNLNSTLNLFNCSNKNTNQIWRYKNTFIKSNNFIYESISNVVRSSRNQYLENLKKINF